MSKRHLPFRSAGVLAAEFLDGWTVYDLPTNLVRLVSPLAGYLLVEAPHQNASSTTHDEVTLESLVSEIVAATGEPAVEVRGAVTDTIDWLVDAKLLGSSNDWEPTPTVSGAPVDDRTLEPTDAPPRMGQTTRVFDERLAFRSSDADLLADIDDWLHLPPDNDTPTVFFDAERTPSGGVYLHAAEEWEFPELAGFRTQLTGVVNDWAARSTTLLVLHAGAIRTPDGKVFVLPGVPEAGKSTLTAAFVAAGCDYLGDELTAIRPDSLEAVGFPSPFSLDDTSREVLRLPPSGPTGPYLSLEALRSGAQSVIGDAGPVSEILTPTYDGSLDAAAFEGLSPRQALETLLGSVMNLARCAEDGWRTVCQLAERVPIRRVRHPDAPAVAAHLLNDDKQRRKLD